MARKHGRYPSLPTANICLALTVHQVLFQVTRLHIPWDNLHLTDIATEAEMASHLPDVTLSATRRIGIDEVQLPSQPKSTPSHKYHLQVIVNFKTF